MTTFNFFCGHNRLHDLEIIVPEKIKTKEKSKNEYFKLNVLIMSLDKYLVFYVFKTQTNIMKYNLSLDKNNI